MAQHREDALDLARVAGDAEPGGVVVGENVVEDLFAAHGLSGRGLGVGAVPELVELGEAVLDGVGREQGGNVRAAAAPVARVDADPLAEQLLDRRYKGVLGRQVQAAKGQVRRGCAPVHGARVVGAWRGHLLVCELRPPKVVGLGGLGNSGFGQVGICPRHGAVAVLFRPVTVPGWCSIVGLGGIVVALAMPGKVDYLVLSLGVGLLVQRVNIVLETLPLRLGAGRVKFCICIICAVDETKI